MKIAEKIRKILKERNISLSGLHRSIITRFEQQSIAYATLLRTVNGQTEIRESSLFQIANALGIQPDELKEGTDKEEQYAIYTVNNNFQYKAFSLKLDFLPMECTIKPKGKGPREQDNIDKGRCVKWVYCIKGEITCVIMTQQGLTEKTLKKDQEFSFDSTNPHYFENRSEKKAVCLIIQSPKNL